MDAAIPGRTRTGQPLIAMTLVLIAVFVPIGFMGGLTGAWFHRICLHPGRAG